jgi:hypothetical protein
VNCSPRASTPWPGQAGSGVSHPWYHPWYHTVLWNLFEPCHDQVGTPLPSAVGSDQLTLLTLWQHSSGLCQWFGWSPNQQQGMLWTILRWEDLIDSLAGANLILERPQREGYSQTCFSENHCIHPTSIKQLLRQEATSTADTHIA